MILITGRANYGAVDSGPRHRVVTQFEHVCFMPFFPSGSRLEIDDMARGMTSIPLKVNWSSVCVAYLRSWGIALAVAAICVLGSAVGELFANWNVEALGSLFIRGIILFAVLAAMFLGQFLLGRTSPERNLQLALFGQHTGLDVDPRYLTNFAEDIDAELQKWIADRCNGQGQTGYRDMPDPQQEWLQIALDPANHDRELVGAAYTLARLRGGRGAHADWRSFRAAEQALWQKFLQLQARDVV
jgi:hypothetical protein